MTPDGVRVRRATVADADAIGRVHVESWRTTYRGIVPQEYLDGLRAEQRAANWRRSLAASPEQSFVFVAERAGAIVGFASGGRERRQSAAFAGELEAIYLLADQQRGGIGHLLVAAVATELLRRDLRSMLLWVLEQNSPARAFYERLGGRIVEQQSVTIGGLALTELANGWHDIAPLAFG